MKIYLRSDVFQIPQQLTIGLPLISKHLMSSRVRCSEERQKKPSERYWETVVGLGDGC